MGVEDQFTKILFFARNWMKYPDLHKFVCHPSNPHGLGMDGSIYKKTLFARN